jgi:hypothetical protein
MLAKFLALDSLTRRAILTVALFLLSFISAELPKNQITDMVLALSMLGWFMTSGLAWFAFLFFKVLLRTVIRYKSFD